MKFVIVETLKGFEVWPDATGSKLTAIFTERSDAEMFVVYASTSGDDRIRNAAFNIASAFPDLNYNNQPINPNGELVLKIARIISADFPARAVTRTEGEGEK